MKEYIGGTCDGCLMSLSRTPFVVDPKKIYALVTGTRVYIPDRLDADEVWLIGTCALRESHQFPGFMKKIRKVKTIRRFSGCPGNAAFHDQHERPITRGTPYEIPDQIALDGTALVTLPGLIRPAHLEAAEARREGRTSLEEFKQSLKKEGRNLHFRDRKVD